MAILSLNAGPLTALFSTDTGFIRSIRFSKEEVVRTVFAAVRDRNWDTIAYSIEDLVLQQDQGSFSINFRAVCQHESIGFVWNGQICGYASGKIVYHFDGVATNTFLRNRLGLCVLHPILPCAGKWCEIGHVDGSVTRGTFPAKISPHQPFKSIRSISHRCNLLPVTNGGGVIIKVTFEGDTFEMEDQRNWSDASFKTYSTPLELPFPVQVEAGTRIEQSVLVEVIPAAEGEISHDASAPYNQSTTPSCSVTVDWEKPLARPPCGFLVADGDLNFPVDQLRDLKPDHLRVDVDLRLPNWREHLEQVQRQAISIDALLEIAVFTETCCSEDWLEFQSLLNRSAQKIARLLLFHTLLKTTPPFLLGELSKIQPSLHPLIPIVVGTNAYFAEFNRDPYCAKLGPLVCFSVNPQVHAFDDLSLSETLEALPWMLDSAQACRGGGEKGTVGETESGAGLSSDFGVVISPVTLRPRFNPNATEEQGSASDRLRLAIDPRQQNGFGAAWSLGVLSALMTHPAVASLTMFEAAGPRGVINEFGSDFPMTEVFRRFLHSTHIFSATITESFTFRRPVAIQALGLQDAFGKKTILLGNLSSDPQDVDLPAEQHLVTLPPQSVITFSC